MDLALHCKIAGWIFWGFALAHFGFPGRFGWREELGRLSLLNRQIFWVHCGFIVFILALLGALCVLCTEALVAPSPLAKPVLLGLALFCFARLFTQFFVYDKKLWKGNPFNTRMHVLFVIVWLYLTLVFSAGVLCQMQR